MAKKTRDIFKQIKTLSKYLNIVIIWHVYVLDIGASYYAEHEFIAM